MSRAVTLANFASGEALTLDETNDRVGIASTSPDATLDVKNTILMDGDAGIITATSFSGDGSSLTGVANTDYVVGTALTMVSVNVSGSATVDGQLSVGGTITYEDVTNIDSVGVVTARVGMKVLAGGINAVGVVTATSYKGDGSALTGIAATDTIAASSLTVSGISTFTGDVGLGSSITSKGTSGKGAILGELEIGLGTRYVTIQPTQAYTESHLNYDRGELKIGANQIAGGGSTITAYADVHLGVGHSANFGSSQKAFIQGHSVGVGTTTTAGLAAGVGTAYGSIVYDVTTAALKVYAQSNEWRNVYTDKNWTVSSPAGGSEPTQTGVMKYTEGASTFVVFYDPGSLVITGDITAEGALLVGGGGVGGSPGGGAGGAGGVLFTDSPFPLSEGTYAITIGDGAPPVMPSSAANPEGPAGGNTPWLDPAGPQWPTSSPTGMVGTPGQSSTFGSHTAYGGENGGASNQNPTYPAVAAYPNPVQQCSFHFPAGGGPYATWSPIASCGSGGSLIYSTPGVSPRQPEATTQQPSAPFTGYGNKGGIPDAPGGNAGSGGAGGVGSPGVGGAGGVELLIPTAWWPDAFSSSGSHFPNGVCLGVATPEPADKRRAFAGGGSSWNDGAGSPYGTGGAGGPSGPQVSHSGTNFRSGAGGAMNTPCPGSNYAYGGKGVFVIKLASSEAG